MRAAILAGILAMTAAAGAKPLGSTQADVPFFLKLPSTVSYARPNAQLDSSAWRSETVPDQGGGLQFGPIHAEAVTDPRPGMKHRTMMQYRVDGVEVLGGAVGGHLGGHGAMLTLHWPNGQ